MCILATRNTCIVRDVEVFPVLNCDLCHFSTSLPKHINSPESFSKLAHKWSYHIEAQMDTMKQGLFNFLGNFTSASTADIHYIPPLLEIFSSNFAGDITLKMDELLTWYTFLWPDCSWSSPSRNTGIRDETELLQI